MFFSLMNQAVAIICGLIVPKLMISAFGSGQYGAITSIATFLSYITLLEGGIGAVTRSALYKAFANKSQYEINAIMTESKRMYRKLAMVFIVYILFLAVFFRQISYDSVFSFWYTFFLVIVIAMSDCAEYFIGITYSLLLQSDQMNYVTVILRTVTTLLNTILIVILIRFHCDILTVKLFSSLVFALQPVALALYVKKRYNISDVKADKQYLENKWSALGQHIAWSLHNNTDISVLTIFKGMAYVAVYQVYSMIVNNMNNLLSAFMSGSEAVFGSMLRNNETDNLKRSFGYYETFSSLMSVCLLSVATVLIVPFVRLYTSGVTDAEYINQPFATMLILAVLLQCMRTPYANMITAAGRFRETQNGAYGEALINIVVSVILVIKMGLIGVAIGTVAATLFRQVFYVYYLSKHILYRPFALWIKRMAVNGSVYALVYVIGNYVISIMKLDSYLRWALSGVLITFIAGALTLALNFIFYNKDVRVILNRGFRRQRNDD